jgi:hypothetical protein
MIFKVRPPMRDGGKFILEVAEPETATEWGFALTAEDMRNLQFVVINARVQYRERYPEATGGIRETAI